MAALTDSKRSEIVAFIRGYQFGQSRPPSIGDITRGLGLHADVVLEALGQLANDGSLLRADTLWNGSTGIVRPFSVPPGEPIPEWAPWRDAVKRAWRDRNGRLHLEYD